jgi:hypothetical protein
VPAILAELLHVSDTSVNEKGDVLDLDQIVYLYKICGELLGACSNKKIEAGKFKVSGKLPIFLVPRQLFVCIDFTASASAIQSWR